jgi:hypothetical protein
MKSIEKKIYDYKINEDKISKSNKFGEAVKYKNIHIFYNTIKKRGNNKFQYESDYVFFDGKWKQDILYFENELYNKIMGVLHESK